MNPLVPFLAAIAVLLPIALQAQPQHAIPFDQLGAEAQKQYKGDGIGIIPTKDGAKLKAIMQDLEAEATPEGLWITSTADEDAGKPNRFRVRAMEVGRAGGAACPQAAAAGHNNGALGQSAPPISLPPTGTVRASKDAVHWLRPGLIEQYRVSTDGVRQDFIVTRRPARNGEALRVDLELRGARAEKAADGARLTLTATGRELAYTRLKVMDATGRELSAEMHVPAPDRLQVLVQDDFAVYPICIDPTFSDADWISMGGVPGASRDVFATAVDSNGNLYIGGEFSTAGGVSASHVAKWDGSAWSALGSGISEPNSPPLYRVSALTVIGSDLYAGGYFTMAGGVSASNIARWNGNTWSALGSGMNNSVFTLAVSGGNLYAAGGFTTAGGVSANYIARWDGSSWSALGSGVNGGVSALAVNGSDLYAGGNFTTADGVSASRIAKWNGSAWSALGLGMNSSVSELAVSAGDLYAGGSFTTAGSVSANRIARWDGSDWSALGSGMNNSVFTLAVVGSDLYAGGSFTTAGGVSANYIARWDGSSWSALGSGMGGAVSTLTVNGSDLYAGGSFTTAGGVSANYIGRWDGSAWLALRSGVDDEVRALAVSGGNLYVGGYFTIAGGLGASRIAKWNGSAWSALGSGMNSTVFALVVSGGELYAGGEFTIAGGVSISRIAKWDGSAWSALGSGMNQPVNALAISGGELYAGGWFTTAGGVSANYIARWDGSSWSALGSGMNGRIYALAVSGSDLYAGGIFTSAGAVSANNIAKWNGSVWSALGSGVSSAVQALAVNGSDLYAGGSISTAGGVSVNGIAKWNGSIWSALGSGVNSSVAALAVNGSDLYAGGRFTTAGGVSANRIAKWDGSAWSALGSGISAPLLGYTPSVNALAVSGGGLYAVGKFSMAGDKTSTYLARANVAVGLSDADGDGLLDSWELTYWPTTTGHGPLDDSDHDGYEELLELAFGLNPTLPNPGNLPPVTEEGGYLTMTITKQPGVTYEVQSAGTLLPALPDSFSSASTTVLINNATTLKVRDNFLMSVAARRFIRVQVVPAP